jgi:hypothetical protein
MEPMGTAAAVSLFVAIHLWGGRLAGLAERRRSGWLSFAGGISVTYVFLHLLPEVGRAQAEVEQRNGGWNGFEQEAYAAALLGLVVFYGLEQLASGSRSDQRKGGNADMTHDWVFVVHAGSFALYNALIGYLLVHGEHRRLAVFALAMALHLLVNDQALRLHHKHRYERWGRWLLSAAVIAGWFVALRTELPALVMHLMIAVLAGGVILNVMKEELPPERESRFLAFLAGVLGYAGLAALG